MLSCRHRTHHLEGVVKRVGGSHCSATAIGDKRCPAQRVVGHGFAVAVDGAKRVRRSAVWASDLCNSSGYVVVGFSRVVGASARCLQGLADNWPTKAVQL